MFCQGIIIITAVRMEWNSWWANAAMMLSRLQRSKRSPLFNVTLCVTIFLLCKTLYRIILFIKQSNLLQNRKNPLYTQVSLCGKRRSRSNLMSEVLPTEICMNLLVNGESQNLSPHYFCCKCKKCLLIYIQNNNIILCLLYKAFL